MLSSNKHIDGSSLNVCLYFLNSIAVLMQRQFVYE